LITSTPKFVKYSKAAIIDSLVAEPSHPGTIFAAISLASFATPSTAPFAATIPATCVPCPLQSFGLESQSPKSYPAITFGFGNPGPPRSG